MSSEGGSTFAAELRRLRREAGLSLEQLAERAGLTAGGIGAIERGERRFPYPNTVSALADAFGLQAGERAAFLGAVPSRRDDGSRGKAAKACPAVETEPVPEPVLRDDWPQPPEPPAPPIGRTAELADAVTRVGPAPAGS